MEYESPNLNTMTAKNKRVVATITTLLIIVILTVSVAVAHHKQESASTVATTTTSATTAAASSQTSSSSTSSSANTASTYKDGTYTASSNYQTPGGTEAITVKLTVSGGSVSSSSISQNSNNRESAQYQDRFQQSYTSSVVGKKLTEISLTRVSGSSLTSYGFDQALESIKSQATQNS